MDEKGTLLTTREAADALGVAPQTIARWVDSGRLTPALRGPGIRGVMWFDMNDVDALAHAIAEDLRARLDRMTDEQPA